MWHAFLSFLDGFFDVIASFFVYILFLIFGH